MTAKHIIVVGGGNAGFCAALAAHDAGASVTVLERAPKALAGGNSAFTAGLMRCAFDGVDDIDAIVELSDEQKRTTEFGSYSAQAFYEDLGRITEYKCDPDLAHGLTFKSHETLVWMKEHGIKFDAAYGRQAFNVDGRFTFWGGVVIETVGGGPGLVEGLTNEAKKLGIEVLYNARAEQLHRGDDGIEGVTARIEGKTTRLDADAVVLAAGGFQANPEMRTRYLGPGWDLAKVRGTRYNTGDGIRMAMEVGGSSAGNWSGCHAVGWDQNAPEFGDLAVGDGFQKHSYPFGLIVNAEGERFVDEGADFRNYTYAKYGRRVLEQTHQFAWQIFDSKVTHLLRDEYKIRQVTKVSADTIEELAAKLEGVDASAFLDTIAEYNASIDQSVAFNPNELDGRATAGITPPKSNWANTIADGPFEAYAITCGITFTFGGVRINGNAEVLDDGGDPVPGLYAAGEMAAGIFYFNYPGGSGLTAGSVYGRIAGARAGQA
ncbi:MAG: tricarballylate dehydrogenase [Acidimicrobiales bacterium]|jgi:tricarballylate dehydrogenase